MWSFFLFFDCLTLSFGVFSEQVFHVPLEERKYKDMNQFGEGEQAKICLEIMQRTGAHLELSLAKDQGLSIMVSGKLDAVMKARKDIVARLQTQVSVARPGIPSYLTDPCAGQRTATFRTFLILVKTTKLMIGLGYLSDQPLSDMY